MKQIEAHQDTNEQLYATKLKVVLTNDDLETQAEFNWFLFTEEDVYVNNGILVCDGQSYIDWDGNSDFPYEFIAEYKNLNII